MWEIVLSLYMLAETSDELVFGQWRRRTLAQLPPDARMLLDLVPAMGYSPDFLSPVLGGHDVVDGIDAVLGTPRGRIGDELGLRFGDGPRPTWTEGLVRKESAAVRGLGHALRDYYDIALRPYWGYITHMAQQSAQTIADRDGPIASIARAVAKGNRLTTAEVTFSRDQDLHLGGRGLLLVPAFFCATNPVPFYDPSLPPVVMYPVSHAPMSFLARAAESGRPSGDVLARVLGRTRAAVLRTLSSAHTTGELARTLDISLPSASEHTSLLRAAGLVASERRGNSVRHRLTPLGLQFLDPIL
ncbi:ArsR/SmtB family transcription factor [Marinactinospora rubrisoli]|uniref:ArsR/SmtB family transcription factor n=1 Tax=Marinactinospora rubrisoli TaxID=2715399 RepID=A0ABW2KAB6_9ACTN